MNRLFHALSFLGVVLTAGVLVTSCERAEVPSAIEAPDIHDGVSVVDSYLHFDSVEAVESYLDDVSLGTARRLPLASCLSVTVVIVSLLRPGQPLIMR